MRRLRRIGIEPATVARMKRMTRIGSRAVLLAIVVCVVSLVAVQFIRIVAKNVAVARELRVSAAEIQTLQARETEQRREIVRLSDPRGAIPEIHDKLRLVGKREEIIYVRGVAPGTPAPGDWRPHP